MKTARATILAWAEQGDIAPADVPRALSVAGVLPSPTDWRRFLEQLLQWLGVVMVATGAIFFFAHNWNVLGRYAKFGMAEALLLVGLVSFWRLGPDRLPGRAVLLGLALVVGALLALIGQVYQTGADAFELFAVWALAILPWVLLARFPVLWVLWLVLVNTAVASYYFSVGSLWRLVSGPPELLWVLFALNTAALALWEILAITLLPWLKVRWAPRLLATVAGTLVTILLVWTIIGWPRDFGLPVGSWPGWLAWTAAIYYVYRHRLLDLYMLAGAALSVILVVTVYLLDLLLADQLTNLNANTFLLIGLVVIALSGASGWWLRRVAARGDA